MVAVERWGVYGFYGGEVPVGLTLEVAACSRTR